MDNYALKPGEVLNGGYTVQIGNFTLRIIGGYEPAWENVYDTENSFADWQGNTKKFLLGRQFSLKLSTGPLTPDDCRALAAELKKSTIAVVCPDFIGDCYCDNIPASLVQANFLATWYKVSFTLTAKDIELSGGGL